METTIEETLKRVSLSRCPGRPARLQWTSPMEAPLLELQALLGAGELREVPPSQHIRDGYFLFEIDLDRVPDALMALLPARCRAVSRAS